VPSDNCCTRYPIHSDTLSEGSDNPLRNCCYFQKLTIPAIEFQTPLTPCNTCFQRGCSHPLKPNKITEGLPITIDSFQEGGTIKGTAHQIKCGHKLYSRKELMGTCDAGLIFLNLTVPDHEKPGSRCRLSKAHN
jgi:hypothetical protein